MNIVVDVSGAGANNNAKAKRRESFRMLMLAHCLDMCSGDVEAVKVIGDSNQEDRRWCTIRASMRNRPVTRTDVLVVSSDRLTVRPKKAGVVVGFKTTAGWSHDRAVWDKCDIHVMHEYAEEFDQDEKLMPIPFWPHDVVLDELFGYRNHLEWYLKDSLCGIRYLYRGEQIPRGVGHIGHSGYGRKQMAAELAAVSSGFEFIWYEGEYPLSPGDYLKKLGSWMAGVFFPGETPKSYRWSELAMLGVPIISRPLRTRLDPPATKDNTVMLRDYTDREWLLDGLLRLPEIAKAQDEAMFAGWTPLATARKLVARLKELL